MITFWIYQTEAIKEIYAYKDYIKNNFALSLLILSASYAIGHTLVLPGALFCVTCGIMFGTYYDMSVFAYIGAVAFWLVMSGIAGLLPFNISRCFLRNNLRTYLIEKSRRLKQFEFIINKYGTKVLFLLRLSPLLPVTIYNYLIGGFNGKETFNLSY
jgi:uncharacterized membrane protein YdjX (TVP38/TMEM64 family)